jgi:hypothetical protein
MRAVRGLMLAAAFLGPPAASAQELAGSAQPPTATADDPTEAAPQISRTRDRGLVEEQVSRGGAAHESVSQIGRPGRNAQAPQPLSDRSAGRTAAVEPVGGKDRCDPAVPRKEAAKTCKDVIETRASDFQRRDPTELSPEQRLLLTREIQGGGQDVANATQRLGRNGQTDDPLEMGIAATVLNRNQVPPATEKETDPKIDAATQAIINAILVNPTTPH